MTAILDHPATLPELRCEHGSTLPCLLCARGGSTLLALPAPPPRRALPAPPIHTTREAWLRAAESLITEELFALAGLRPAYQTRLSCGIPQGGINVIGECYHPQVSADGAREVFVSPVLANPLGAQGVLSVLLHELVHAALDPAIGHGPEFAAWIAPLGMTGAPTETVTGPALAWWFRWSVLPRLGTYPHAVMNPHGYVAPPLPPGPRDRPFKCPTGPGPRRKQSTRMHRYVCGGCGQKLRAAKTDLAVLCMPCGVPFTYSPTSAEATTE